MLTVVSELCSYVLLPAVMGLGSWLIRAFFASVLLTKELHFSRILNLRQKKQVILIPHSLHTEYHCDQHTCNPVNLNHDLGRALTRMASGSTRSTTGFPAARLLPVFFLLLYSTGMTPLPPPPYLIHLRLLMGCHALRNPTTRCAASLQCPHELVASCPRHLC